MNDDSSDGSSGQKSFFDRLIQVFGSEPQSRAELLEILRDAHQRQLVDQDSMSMIEGVFEVASMRVRDVMIPRAQMVSIDHDSTLEEILDTIAESGHSRFPVIGENQDEVLGVLIAKDLVKIISKGEDAFDLSSLLRPASITPETKRLNLLLREFRDQRNHLAVVVDEYGGISGVVTIEDVLETIVGDIDDEHDREDEVNIRLIGENRYAVSALTPIEEFNETLETEFDDTEYDTIGGLVIKAFGHLPKPGELVELEQFNFRVLSGDSRRIHMLQVQVRN
ncbi:MAG: CBS domain-containing protein [Gammaproteobacteria bacterium]|nr:CBS domain-containing protein [Gammaproteobacteria bacterium]